MEEDIEEKPQEEFESKNMTVLAGQECPVCHTNNCTLTELEKYIPFAHEKTLIYIFSMSCSNCGFHKADIEFAEEHEPVKYTLDVDSEDDMRIRIIKSAEATVKIPHIMTIESGPGSNGYISNIEGLFNRVKHAVEIARDNAEEEEDKRKAKNLLKKIQRIMWGQEKVRVIIEDPTGNSAIISEKAVKSKL